MLKLTGIVKNYEVGDGVVRALRGINLSFRKSEFVSILGPSGCGKTTLLNIIGGLDKYTSGDLMINGVSTKQFKDHDWDVYRNHRIGFIFQSYNLIPHQTVLGNVELALTIAGLNKAERIEKAKKALDRVGLSDQYNKKPNQLSGGQGQRVAIARALVNDPEILLADEPTGALDTVTSVQIMELVKEISKERLVIMVTHNADIAEKYSTRIVKMLDGEITDDSNPFSASDEEKEVSESKAAEQKVHDELEKTETGRKSIRKSERAKMSFFTAFKLSFKNLLSKKGRTIMTGVAGSIGIIGVSLVLAISSGVNNYIVDMQDDLLSGNPVTVSETAYDLSALMGTASIVDTAKATIKDGYVNVDSMIEYLAKSAEKFEDIAISNEITETYIDYVKAMPKEYYADIAFKYGIDVTNNIYTDFKRDSITESVNISLSALKEMYTSILLKTDFKDYASYITSLSTIMSQAINNEEYILSQYEILGNGRIAKNKNEIMIVVDENRAVTDLVLTQLGYYTQEEFLNIAYRAAGEGPYDETLDKHEFPYEELYGKKFTYYPNDTVFSNGTNPISNPFVYKAYSDSSFQNGLELEVVGILQPKEGVSYGSMTSGFYYTSALTDYILETNASSIINKTAITTGGFTTLKTIIKNSDGTETVTWSGQDITYTYDFYYDGVTYEDTTGHLGTTSSLSSIMGMFMGGAGGTQTEIYTLSLRALAGNSIPNRIQIYPHDFDYKDEVTGYLDKWNSENDIYIEGYAEPVRVSERQQITYTDTFGLVINMINNMVNIITSALVAFTALSLVVSTVMIGIITYVSVVERVKEIGVIRSLGGRKKDVSYLFNAETFIIGLVAGIIGILITYLLSLVINIIVGSFTAIYTIAALPWWMALIMIGISILLTLISGLIPSRAAAKKDPVVALRTE